MSKMATGDRRQATGRRDFEVPLLGGARGGLNFKVQDKRQKTKDQRKKGN
jgi:hypothetical protein